jgi:uncharacterized protein (TIGR02246 family)
MTAKGEARVRETIDALAQALRDKDTDTLMTHYAPDVVTFDVVPPLRVDGAEAYRRNFETWFASVRGPIDYEVRDLRIACDDHLAVCHHVARVRSTRTMGAKSDYEVRVTSVLQMREGRWLVTHEHISMPVDMQTMQAASGAGH